MSLTFARIGVNDFLFVLHQVVANVMSDIAVFIINYFMNKSMIKMLSMLLEGTICGMTFYCFVVPNSTIVNGANNRTVVFDASTGIMYVLVLKSANGYICIVQNNPCPHLL